MSDVNSDIRNAFTAFIKRVVQPGVETFSAEVIDVNVAARTCIVRSISTEVEVEYSDVGLMPQISDGILIIPKKESIVLVHNPKNLSPSVIMYSEVDSITLTVEKTILSMTGSGLNLNGDFYGGLPMIGPLFNMINRMESKMNDLISLYNNHTHVVSGSVGPAPGAITGTAAPTTDLSTPIAPLTQRSDLENTKVKQGKGA